MSSGVAAKTLSREKTLLCIRDAFLCYTGLTGFRVDLHTCLHTQCEFLFFVCLENFVCVLSGPVIWTRLKMPRS
jgi:hypothetical protein